MQVVSAKLSAKPKSSSFAPRCGKAICDQNGNKRQLRPVQNLAHQNAVPWKTQSAGTGDRNFPPGRFTRIGQTGGEGELRKQHLHEMTASHSSIGN
jgi:hypothetical protein